MLGDPSTKNKIGGEREIKETLSQSNCVKFFTIANLKSRTPTSKLVKLYSFKKNGLPMGGLISAGMAVINAMYKEHHNQSL